MPVTRNDLIEQQALYKLPNKDGLWKVHNYNEQPSVTVHNIESGELYKFEMSSMDNVRCERVRYIESADKITPPKGVDVTPKPQQDDAELQELAEEVELLKLMLSDAHTIIGDVISVDRPKKELKDAAQSWYEQVASKVEQDEDDGEDED